MNQSNGSTISDQASDTPRLAIFIPAPDTPPAIVAQSSKANRPKPSATGVSDTRSSKATKPEKPREDFPLFPHDSGRWAKKVRGKFRYFGKWTDDPTGEKAVNIWLDQKDDLLAGREPRPKGDDAGPTVKLACDSFLTHKEQQRDNGEIQPRTFDELEKTCLRVAAAFGRERLVTDLRPDDFRALRKDLAKTRGLVALSNEIQRTRSVFKFAFDEGIIDVPIRFGKGFDKPSKDKVRIERNAKGRRDLSAEQIRAIIDKAGIPLKAFVLLAVNCGFGNNDVGTLPLSAIDLAAGWISYARPKTGVSRRAKLWPQTIAAVKAALDARPEPNDNAHSGLAFITKYGTAWAKGAAGNDPVGGEFKKVLKDLGFHRDGIGFYSLRRTFRTVADQVRDTHAIDLVMGHAADANDMGALYTQNIDDDRLAAVAEHVRRWLFPAKPREVEFAHRVVA